MSKPILLTWILAGVYIAAFMVFIFYTKEPYRYAHTTTTEVGHEAARKAMQACYGQPHTYSVLIWVDRESLEWPVPVYHIKCTTRVAR